jgi:murein DD-endopeptidase MepM/ murein hydrolase activator NlpD
MEVRFMTAVLAALALLFSGVPAATSVSAISTENIQEPRVAPVKKKKKKGRVCPTKNFWVGAGWGADRGRRTHMGIDLAAKRGTPIFAVESGRIDRTKRQSNGALQIVLKGKSGSKYYYGHMDKVLVKGGQRVKKGKVIGLMGDTGSPGQVHLHFEYWKSGRESAAINPIRLMKRICKRI